MVAKTRVASILGATLTALPVAFMLFPGLAQTPPAVRIALAVVWIPGAVLLWRAGERRGARIDDLLGPPLERRELQRGVAGARLIRTLLSHSGLPRHYEFRLYLYDADLDRLLPSYEPGRERSTGWARGQGVTGRAWETGEYEVARGEAAADETYGLTPEQQRRYRHLRVVAAMPVRSARQEVIAILTGSSTNDDGHLVSPDGKDRHSELADVVARVLIDILRVTGD